MNYRDKYNLWLTFDENTKASFFQSPTKKRLRTDFIRTLPSAPAAFAALWAPAQTE